MLELVGALITALLTWQGVTLLVTRGIALGWRQRRRDEREHTAKWRHAFTNDQRAQRERSHQPIESEAEVQPQKQRVQAAELSEESEWWTVLEVSPDASPNKIRQSYLRKIKQSHPDRVAWLGPEFVEWGEKHTKALNVAYAEAIRARETHR